MPLTALKLLNTVNPEREDNAILVIASDSTQRDVTSGGAINEGDTIVCEASASGTLAGAPGDVTIAAFTGDDPATVDVDWENVVQVDEYYNGPGTDYDITIDVNDENINIVIQG